ncbi:FAD-binding protein [Actinophytocola sp.]|uniref:FAD-binding protein n=1 Tax=Actinophytocola sp. TaxID=1872138 RepID=UPI002D810CEC|nr:FAD-binding protein [Actinophytocola sp.]HET9142829.1 FAD-binding protein [Actinophytocola sp.]
MHLDRTTAPGGIEIPGLDGELVVDPAVLAEAGEDYGHVVRRPPVAVLRPGSVRDIVTAVRFANQHGITVAMRGQGHGVYGAARATLVIDSRALATIHRIDPDSAVVDAGVRWGDLTRAALAAGRTPPVATDYLGLSVGGTLSVGGIGGASGRHGLQVDTVRELEVVTGDGRLVRCSARHDAELFDAVLGGLGQFGIIARATVALVAARATARIYRLTYASVAALTAGQRTVLADGRFDHLQGQVLPEEGGGYRYELEGAVYYTAPNSPADAAVLAGLSPLTTEIEELPYFDWLNRISEIVDELAELRLPNPWLNLFLPDTVVDEFVARTLADLTPADTGGGVILLYPVRREALTRPFVPVPRTPVVFLFSLLRMVIPPDRAEVRRLLRANAELYEQARELGATQYAIGAIPMTPQDWRRHYGAEYPRVVAAKARFDPQHILTPGPQIFPE